MAGFAITPQNFWLFFGAIWLAAGGLFLIIQLASGEPPIVGGVLIAVGGTLVFKALAKRKRDEALRRHGMPAEATITQVAPASIRINRVQQWAIHYRYPDAYGKSHDDSRLIAPEEAPQWQVGQTVAVKYDLQRPHLHIWIGPGS